MIWVASTLLTTAIVGLSWTFAGGPAGLVYLAAYVLATMPGWPVGWWLFGRKHAAGWIGGALIGYGLTAWTIWLAVAVNERSPLAQAIGWALLTSLTWTLWWFRQRSRTAKQTLENSEAIESPLIALPIWSRRDTIGLLFVLCLVPLVVARPFGHIGARDAEGNQRYRAYFTADVLWHGALTAELVARAVPPTNPYAFDQHLHYYWTYFLVPASITSLAPRVFAAPDYIPWLVINATMAGLLFIGSIAVFAWCISPGRAALIAVALIFVAASPEGFFVLLTNWRDGFPLSYVREWNIDAATRIFYEGLSIDGLPRSLWYTPQHAGACAFGLLALTIAAASRVRRPIVATVAAGIILALSVTFSPLPGGMFALIYGVGLIARWLFERRWRELPKLVLMQILAVIPVLLAVAAVIRWEMVEGAGGGMFAFGFYGYARHYPIATMMMSLGPAIVPAIIGLWPLRRMPPGLLVSIAGCVAGTALFYLVTMPEGDQVWIGWRGGQILQVCLPPLIARGLVALQGLRWPRLGPAVITLLFLIGLPTTVIDEYNAQDVNNDLMGPGFRWTVTLTPDEQEAMAWLRRTTSNEAVVQMDVSVRGRETWTLIPTFAQRRMMAGLPISLLPSADYDRRALRVRRMFGLTDAEEAWKTARSSRIDYFYVDRTERAAFQPESLAKFDHSPDFFRPVFRNREVSIYAVVH